jgi:hypothetical protein
MKRTAPIWLIFGLLASAPAQAADDAGFRSLWTGWNAVSRESTERERAAVEQVREDLARADARRLAALGIQGRDLGEQVGEIVRLGDCEGGERVAREAGDFALVEAVRSHCRALPAS